MATTRRFLPLFLVLSIVFSLLLPAQAQELISGLVTVEDETCIITAKGKTLAEFAVEAPLHATLTTSQGSLAVVVWWGDFTEEEQRTVLLPDLELLQLEGEFSLVTLTDLLPDTLAIETLPTFSANGLEIGSPGPVTANGGINTFYLTSPLSPR